MLTFSEFLAGWFSGICAVLVGHPADTLKIRYQTMQTQPLWDIFYKTLTREGIRGFYKGISFPLLFSGVYNAIFFGVFGNTLRWLSTDPETSERRLCCEEGEPEPNFHAHVGASGALGGITGALVGCPVDHVKSHLQSYTGHPQKKRQCTGPIDCVVVLYSNGGVRKLYRGFVPNIMRDMPGYCIYMLVYDHFGCKLQGEKIPMGRSFNPWPEILAGGTAGCVSWVLITPFDVIKSRMQTDDIRNPVYRGMWDCVSKSLKSEGPGIFMRGVTVSVMRAFPVNAAVFVSYNWAIHSIQNFRRAFGIS